jgi:hypothetical protein
MHVHACYVVCDVRQVDFVGHVANPHFVRGQAYGIAAAKVAALRNKRVEMKVGGYMEVEAAGAESTVGSCIRWAGATRVQGATAY